jgi:hypothetical protein
MPQVFRPPAVFALKLALLAAVLVVALIWVTIYKALPAHSGALSPQQPIAFSHKHHVGDDGIDCRYCHWSVEKSSFAGIPSAQVCLTCHSQLFSDAAILEPLRESARTGKPLAWARVHDLPDFVYFDHSIHVAKGVGCVECHGHVERMPRIERVASLEMQWCLECHRREAADRHLSVQRMTDCSTCHR